MKVSIVTPSYNQGRFIERTLASVGAQDGAAIEHVVFDGGSTDETVSILRRHEPAVRWTSRPDRGQSDAVNQGIRATDGAIIGWLNSDDIYYPGAVRKVLAVFEAHPAVDVVYGMANHIDIHDQAFEPYPTEHWEFEKLQRTCFICQPALFLRRSVIERWGLLDESLHYCMDYEYWLRLGQAGAEFHYLPEVLAGSRLYPDNKTLSARPQVHAEINDMLRQKFGRVPERWLINYAHAVLDVRGRSHNRLARQLALGACAVAASLRWNHGLSRAMCRSIFNRLRDRSETSA